MRGETLFLRIHRPPAGEAAVGEDESDLRCIALKAKLRAAVESAIHEGMEHFICGMAEGCDLYFAETVLALKSTYPHITLEAAIPCPSQADGWGEAQKIPLPRHFSSLRL